MTLKREMFGLFYCESVNMYDCPKNTAIIGINIAEVKTENRERRLWQGDEIVGGMQGTKPFPRPASRMILLAISRLVCETPGTGRACTY